jgi:hypothetical protein
MALHLQSVLGHSSMNSSDVARFWSKVDVRGPDECWLWKAARQVHGYGAFRVDGETKISSRFSFFLTHGRWPEGFCCHSCDNPPCCNPAHLFEGSQDSNMKDAGSKGRMPRGERHWNSKLTTGDVQDIVANYTLCRVTQRELGIRYGVGPDVISRIVTGKRWRHVTGAAAKP